MKFTDHACYMLVLRFLEMLYASYIVADGFQDRLLFDSQIVTETTKTCSSSTYAKSLPNDFYGIFEYFYSS